MHGQRVGYIRVSSFDQKPERQLEGVVVDRVSTDKASGKNVRPKFDTYSDNYLNLGNSLFQIGTTSALRRVSVDRWCQRDRVVRASGSRAPKRFGSGAT